MLTFGHLVEYTAPAGTSLCDVGPSPTPFQAWEEDVFTAHLGRLTNLTNTRATFEQPVAWSPSGRIAFVAEPSREAPYLATANPDGSNVRKVELPVTVYPGRVALSPTGRRIVFVGQDTVYVANSNGSHARVLTHLAQCLSPSWSPNGTKIAFARFGSTDFRGIWVMRSNGTNAHRVALGTDPSWAPDGNRLVYTHDGARYDGSGNLVGTETVYVKDLRTLKPGVPLR
jgi:Tol biopolymer transport system component